MSYALRFLLFFRRCYFPSCAVLGLWGGGGGGFWEVMTFCFTGSLAILNPTTNDEHVTNETTAGGGRGCRHTRTAKGLECLLLSPGLLLVYCDNATPTFDIIITNN